MVKQGWDMKQMTLTKTFSKLGFAFWKTCLWPEFAKGMEREILKGRAIWNDSLHRYISRMLMDIYIPIKWTFDNLDTSLAFPGTCKWHSHTELVIRLTEQTTKSEILCHSQRNCG